MAIYNLYFQSLIVPHKLARRRGIRRLESRRNFVWPSYDQESREVIWKKDDLLDDIGNRMRQRTDKERLFVVRWSV